MILDYGEPQILEVFKNTLPNRLYWVLFPIDNLRQAVETAKRVLMKEKIDRQLSGQSSTTPFMKVSAPNKSSFGKSSKKAVSFNTLETIERTNNSVVKFSSLVSNMKVQMDKHDAQYNP